MKHVDYVCMPELWNNFSQLAPMSRYRVRFVRVSLYIGSVGHLTAGAPTCIVVVMYSVQYVWGATVILNLQSFSPTYCNRRGGGGRRRY